MGMLPKGENASGNAWEHSQRVKTLREILGSAPKGRKRFGDVVGTLPKGENKPREDLGAYPKTENVPRIFVVFAARQSLASLNTDIADGGG